MGMEKEKREWKRGKKNEVICRGRECWGSRVFQCKQEHNQTKKYTIPHYATPLFPIVLCS